MGAFQRIKNLTLNVRSVIKLIIVILGLFAVAKVMWMVSEDRKKEARIAELDSINKIQQDSLVTLVDTVVVLGGALEVALVVHDSLRAETGEIVYRTLTRTIRLAGDTVVVVDTVLVPTVIIGADTIEIPVAVAQELEACRILATTCEEYKGQVDSLIAYVPTVIDSMQVLIDVMRPKKINLLGLRIPMPKGSCGIYGGYRITGGDGSTEITTDQFDEFAVTTTSSTEQSRWNVLLGCGVGFLVF